MSSMFWTSNPIILFNPSHIYDIWISKHTLTLETKMNAISRFVLIYGTIISVMKKKSVFMLYTFLSLLGIILFYKILKNIEINNAYYHQSTTHHSTDPSLSEPQTEKSCRRSTKHNAFANPIIGDTTNMSDYCEDNNTQNYDKFFKANNPVNIEDVFGRESSRRQFYSIVKNDQTAFANSLYGTGPICKTDRTVCTGY
jgi:hypothetical protein